MFFKEQRGSANKSTEFREVQIDTSKFCEIPVSIMRFSKVLKPSPRSPKGSQRF